jgi:hypothetical protein
MNSWRSGIESFAHSGCTIAVSRTTLPFLCVMARCSKAVRRRLARDLEFLDFVGIQILDSCLLSALDIPLDIWSGDVSFNRKLEETWRVSLLSGLLTEKLRCGRQSCWTKHASEADRAKQFLPIVFGTPEKRRGPEPCSPYARLLHLEESLNVEFRRTGDLKFRDPALRRLGDRNLSFEFTDTTSFVVEKPRPVF